MVIEVKPTGFSGPIVSVSDEWIAVQAIFLNVSEDEVVDSVLEYKIELEKLSLTDICVNGLLHLSDFLPKKVVDSKGVGYDSNKRANDLAVRTAKNRQGARDVMVKLRMQLGMK